MPGNSGHYLEPSDRDREVAAACLEHAQDLLASADLLLQHGQPHIAFHLALVALEEIGKRAIFGINSVCRRVDEADAISDKKLEDHVGKLFWALFFPLLTAERVDRAKIEELRGFARSLHGTRLAGLYVSSDREPFQPPRTAVPEAQARVLVSVVRARLEMEKVFVPTALDSDRQELAAWLLQASSDEHFCCFMFGEGSLAKLRDLQDWGEWVAWLRERQADGRAAFAAMLDADRRRVLAGTKEGRPRWKMRLRLAGVSHKLRPSVLGEWNTEIDAVKLEAVRAGKRALDVTLTIPDRVPLDSLYLAGLITAERLILALNIGTCGFFWWEQPQHTARFYEKLVDVDTNQEVVLSEMPELKIDWGGKGLSTGDLDRVANVLVALPTRLSGVIYEPFAWYLDGLSFFSTICVYRRHEKHAFACFYESLWSCLARLGGEQPERTLDWFLRAVPEDLRDDPKIRGLHATGVALTASASQELALTLEDVAWMKTVVEWYVARWAMQQLRTGGAARGATNHPAVACTPSDGALPP